MKNKHVSNLLKGGLIVVAIVSFFIILGLIRGELDIVPHNASLTTIEGTVLIEREGVLIQNENDTILKSGDRIICKIDTIASVQLDKYSWLTLGANSEIVIINPSIKEFKVTILSGEIFASASTINLSREIKPITLCFNTQHVIVKNAIASLRVSNDIQSICVFNGVVNETEQGRIKTWEDDNYSIETLEVEKLSDFEVNQLLIASEYNHICFSFQKLNQQLSRQKPNAN